MERRLGGISRRDSLKLAGAFLAGGVFGSCDRQSGGRNNTVFSPAAATQEVQPGWEQDAIFNAASFQLQLNILNGSSRIVSGHGSLFKNSNGRVDLKSVGHIVLPEGISQRNTSLSVLPPTGSNRFLIEAGRIAGDFSDPDGIVDISLPDDLNAFVKGQIDMGAIIPLEAFSYKGLSAGDTLATPGLNGALEMVYKGYDPANNLILCTPKEGTVCKGFSGQAVVRVDGRGVTNKSVGLVDEANFPDINLRCTASASQYFLRPVV